MNQHNRISPDLDELVRLSEQSIAVGSKSFAAASRIFDPDTRGDVVMLYAWCRHADDLIDGQTAGHNQQADFRTDQRDRLVRLRKLTESTLAGQSSDDPAFRALNQVVRKHDIPHDHPMELIDGFRMDVDERKYETLQDTIDYSYHVAGVVGVMMAMIMGVRSAATLDRASDLGIAFQLTNIARDIMDDASAGRIYLPGQWLREAGLTSIDPDNKSDWPALHGMALRLVDHADIYYDSAYWGLGALPWRSAWAIASARRIYRYIGQVLRKEGPSAWEQRVSTTRAQKIALFALSAFDVLTTRIRRAQPARKGLYSRP